MRLARAVSILPHGGFGRGTTRAQARDAGAGGCEGVQPDARRCSVSISGPADEADDVRARRADGVHGRACRGAGERTNRRPVTRDELLRGDWSATIDVLRKEGFRVVVPDQVGFGRSSKPIMPYTLLGHGVNTHKLLETLGIAKAAIVGHSMGGMVAARFALFIPIRPSGWCSTTKSD